jgi:alpha-beta hydrolase superfamily lysophospholipase
MIAFGTSPAPPPLATVYDVKAMDTSGAPPQMSFAARDGSGLAYRQYPGGSAIGVVLIHGSTATSLSMHPLGKALNARGFSVFVPDVRGHGASGRRGDIDYVGQLDDDLADFVSLLKAAHPGMKLELLGFSAGGGFALRFAGGPYGEAFDRYILVSPYLGHEAPTNQPGSGGWAVA